MFAPFSISRLPRILFGAGQIGQLPGLVRQYGAKALLVTGVQSFRQSSRFDAFSQGLAEAGVVFESMTVSGEPSPEVVDEAVSHYYGKGIEVVVGIGGGSVLDAAKAIAGLLPHGNSVMDQKILPAHGAMAGCAITNTRRGKTPTIQCARHPHPAKSWHKPRHRQALLGSGATAKNRLPGPRQNNGVLTRRILAQQDRWRTPALSSTKGHFHHPPPCPIHAR